MRRLLTIVAFSASLLPWAAHAAPTTEYAINLGFGTVYNDSFAALGQGQLTGTIVTDGTVGSLAASNVVSWSFTFAIAGVYSLTIDSAGIAGTPDTFLRGDMFQASAVDLRLVPRIFPTDTAGFTNFANNRRLEVTFARSSGDANQVSVGFKFPSASPVNQDSAGVFAPYNTVLGTAVVTAVPEPGAWALMAAGLVGVAGAAARRRTEA